MKRNRKLLVTCLLSAMALVSFVGCTETSSSSSSSTSTVSLESVNVIRVIDTLEQRQENIITLAAINELYYIDGASYGELRSELMSNIDLTKYKEIQSYTEMIEQTIIQAPAQVHPNDSGVSNEQGGTIAESELEEHNINPQSPTA